mgnify:CR=1 FL=1
MATTLLRLRLVACEKWWPIASSYWCKQRHVRAKQTALLFETTKKHFGKVEALIRRLHSDEVPCIVSWRIESGSTSYMRWFQRVMR